MFSWIFKKYFKRTISTAIVITLILLMSIPITACSSFAVYGDKIYYGMNWDYYTDHDAVFSINTIDKMKIFTLIDANEGFTPIGMNTEGMFASMQNVYPEEHFNPHDSKLTNINMKELLKYALFQCSNLTEVKAYLKGKRLNYSSIDLHDMIADSKGNAMIAEAGKKTNMITEMEDKFLVMTNFSNYYFKDKKYNEIYAQTSDKYITAYEYILNNKDSFSMEKGFELLKGIVWTGTYTTRCSFVFDPQEKVVYIAAERNFKKIWKVSIENETIETYKGFERPMKLNVKGMRLSDLTRLADYDKKTMKNLNNKFITKPDLGQQTKVQVIGIESNKPRYGIFSLWICLAVFAGVILLVSAIIIKKRHQV